MRHLLSTQGLFSEILDKNKKDDPYNPKLIYKDKCGSSLYIGMAPGKKDRRWNRSLRVDLNDIKSLGVDIVVCLLAPQEVTKLKMKNYEDEVGLRGMRLIHIPIKDMSIPSMDSLFILSSFISREISSGKSVLIHCRCGKGRSKTIAGAVLSCLGEKHHTLENKEGKIDISDDQIRIIHLHSVSLSRKTTSQNSVTKYTSCSSGSYSCGNICRNREKIHTTEEVKYTDKDKISAISGENMIYGPRIAR